MSAITTLGNPDIGLKVTAQVDVKINYDLLDAKQGLLKADEILDQWKRDRRSVIERLRQLQRENSVPPPLQAANLIRQVAQASPGMERVEAVLQIHDPWKGVIPKDEDCITPPGGQATLQSGVCLGCTLLGRLWPKGQVAPETSVIIKAGSQVGKKIHLKRYRRGVHIEKGLQGYREVSPCLTLSTSDGRSKQDFWANVGPSPEHVAISNFYLETVLEESKLPANSIVQWLFECGSEIAFIELIPSLGVGSLDAFQKVPEYLSLPRSPTARVSPLNSLSGEVMRGIILQLAATLHRLSREDVRFVLGQASLQSLGFDAKPVAFIYDGVKIASPITTIFIASEGSSWSLESHSNLARLIDRKIEDAAAEVTAAAEEKFPIIAPVVVGAVEREIEKKLEDKAAVTATRLFHPGYRDKYWDGKGIENVEASFGPASKARKGKGFRFNPMTVEFARVCGYPLFGDSLDLYGLLVSLVIEPSFFGALIENELFMEFWQSLWVTSEYEILMIKLGSLRGTRLNAQQIVQLLSQYTLRVDAAGWFWGQIKHNAAAH